MLMRRWTPPSSPIPTTSAEQNTNVQKQRTCIRWAKLFLLGIIAIAIICFCIIYTIQKENFFNEEYSRQQENQNHEKKQVLLEKYIEDISNILLKASDEKSILYIQTKTLMLLKNVDSKQKKDIIWFLFTNKLLENKQMNFHGADFNDVELICPINLQQRLYLPGVQWLNAVFINCDLTGTNFNQANLFNARFINSTLQNISFIQTNLDQSQFIQTVIRYVDFTDASLIQSNFFQTDIVQGNHFINADLYQANLTKEQFEGKYYLTIKNDFTNARYPNGSFELGNSEINLVLSKNAKADVRK